MENVYEFPDRSVIELEAGKWLVKLDGEIPLTSDDRLALQEWISRSPAHREEIKNLATFWGKMNVLTELAVPLGKTDGQIERERVGGRRNGLFRARVPMAVAACLLGFTVVFTFWLAPNYQTDNGLYATAVGQQVTTTLVDGSVIQLNTNSQIQVSYNKQYRDIRLLQGEAHFTVAKNPDRPFRVHAGNGRVEAIGTAFSVYLKDANIDVTVTEGRVGLVALSPQQSGAVNSNSGSGNPDSNNFDSRLSAQSDRYERSLGQLEAGQTTRIKNILVDGVITDSTIELTENIDEYEIDKQLSWRKGLLMFTGDPLETVVAEISRYTTVSIEIVDPAVRAIKIGGQFRVGETDAMLDSLETNFGLQVKRVGYNQVQLSMSQE